MVELLGAQEVRNLAAELDLRPTKKLGQNFVIDPNTIRKIIDNAQLHSDDVVVEIGPGLGSLTLGLLAKQLQVLAIEVDDRLAKRLGLTIAQRAPGSSCRILNQDALKVSELPVEPTALVANLPYNISVPVILHFLETFKSLQKGLVLVQSEVAARLAAKPGSRVYGAPSVKLAWYAESSLAGVVSRNVFWPVPNVDSALVFFQKRREPFPEAIRSKTFQLIDAAFAQRRKTLRQALAKLLGSAQQAEDLLVTCGISPKARGEQLSISDFVRLAQLS